ncbi:MAG TPA: DUF2188 domain-containing protein [Gemmatimonadaceae bacterium]|jgi:hypothetical protein|nr:DUF2188 domain-containing protein [Gemmatimonadota bacterium]HNV77424.1 DUF2188 domain-containing protein [Gemmatimonadaceae bacterium]MBK6842914.1 DUF2188 domain-containing protein [Gemmatimonadota bacterium]MBK7831370.1 DUF2188 domain-containing protein [Gemmatimonadota bacterium]MBK8056329.1 DUF2188 domain-containing protein [Gemmatimonadota bacterium]
MSRKERRNVHVVPAGTPGAFIARIAGGAKLFTEPTTQEEAIRLAIVEAKARGSEVVIHRPDGRIRDKDSYGNDSPRVRDLKH